MPTSITIRLTDEQAAIVERAATSSEQSVSAFVRSCLFQRESFSDQLDTLQASILGLIDRRLSGNKPEAQDSGTTDPSQDRVLMGILVELLMHVRASSNPSKMRPIHAEVERLGLTVYGRNS